MKVAIIKNKLFKRRLYYLSITNSLLFKPHFNVVAGHCGAYSTYVSIIYDDAPYFLRQYVFK